MKTQIKTMVKKAIAGMDISTTFHQCDKVSENCILPYVVKWCDQRHRRVLPLE